MPVGPFGLTSVCPVITGFGMRLARLADALFLLACPGFSELPAGEGVVEQFMYTGDDVLRMLDALLAGRHGAWWDEFFAHPPRPIRDRRPGSLLR